MEGVPCHGFGSRCDFESTGPRGSRIGRSRLRRMAAGEFTQSTQGSVITFRPPAVSSEPANWTGRIALLVRFGLGFQQFVTFPTRTRKELIGFVVSGFQSRQAVFKQTSRRG